MSRVEPRFDTKIALSVANAIYRKKGYVKTTEADYGERKSNKSLVLEELSKENNQLLKQKSLDYIHSKKGSLERSVEKIKQSIK